MMLLVYIPTQEVRYSKLARLTLFLCVMLPSAVVMWLGGDHDLVSCAMGFLWPLALPLAFVDFPMVGAICCSALVQASVFFLMVRSHKLSPRGKATFSITWGMLFAFLLRLALAYQVWLAALPGQTH